MKWIWTARCVYYHWIRKIYIRRTLAVDLLSVEHLMRPSTCEVNLTETVQGTRHVQTCPAGRNLTHRELCPGKKTDVVIITRLVVSNYSLLWKKEGELNKYAFLACNWTAKMKRLTWFNMGPLSHCRQFHITCPCLLIRPLISTSQ